MIKKLWNILLLLILIPIYLYSSTRGDIKIIEASESIRYLSQKISKEYLYFYKNPKKIYIKEQLNRDIKYLKQSIQDIANINSSRDSNNILNFLRHNIENIEKLINKDVDRKKALNILNYSESFLEGSNSIEKQHKYKFSTEEEILMSFKNIEYLLQKISKYYIAYTLKINRKDNLNSMKIAINKIDNILSRINSYNYPKRVFNKVREANSIWIKHKELFYKLPQLELPNLISISTLLLEDNIKKIASYYGQNH